MRNLYDGIIDDAAWHAALDAIISEIGGATVFFGEADFRARTGAVTSHRSPADLLAVFSGPLASPEVNPIHRAMPTMPTLQAIPTSRLCPDAQMVATRFYQEGLDPHGLSYGVGTLFERDAGGASFAAVWRERGGRDFTAAEIEAFAAWLPHLSTVVRLRARIAETRIRADRVAAAFETLVDGWALIDPRGTLLEANAAARKAIAERRHLRSEASLVRPAHPADGGAFAAALAEAAAGRGIAVVALRGADEVPPLVVKLRPFAGGATIALTFRGEDAATAERAQGMAMAYGLTRAEARLATALATGRGLQAAARELGISVNTAKSQRDALFGKVGVARQTALIARLTADGLL